MTRHEPQYDTGSIVAVVGAAVLALGAGGGYTRFVRPYMRSLLVAAGGLLVVLGAALLWRQWRVSRRAGQPGVSSEHLPRAAWLLLAPVFVLVLVAPASLGSYASGGGDDLLQLRRSYLNPLPQSSGGVTAIPVSDVLERLRWDPASLAGRRVRLIGLVRPVAGHADEFTLVRFYIACCAADAIPMTVKVRTSEPPPPRDSWVAVEGIVQTPPAPVEDGPLHPVMDATSVSRTDTPSHPYEG